MKAALIYPPLLAARRKSLTLRNVAFRGRHLDIAVRRDAHGRAVLSMTTLPTTGSSP